MCLDYDEWWAEKKKKILVTQKGVSESWRTMLMLPYHFDQFARFDLSTTRSTGFLKFECSCTMQERIEMLHKELQRDWISSQRKVDHEKLQCGPGPNSSGSTFMICWWRILLFMVCQTCYQYWKKEAWTWVFFTKSILKKVDDTVSLNKLNSLFLWQQQHSHRSE